MKRQLFIIAFALQGIALAGVASQPSATGSGVSNLHRLYDFTPVSTTNPVVARVKQCGIEITLSELRSYVNSTPQSDGTTLHPVSPEQKRAKLEKLLNEHFLICAGYQQKADQTADIVHMLNVTESMLLRETLLSQEVGAKAKTAAEYQRLSQELTDRIFDQAEIIVSNEAYQDIKENVKLLHLTAGTPADKSNISLESSLDKLTPTASHRIFAKCKLGTITIEDFLRFYARIPSNQRPDIETHDGVAKILEQILANDLLTEEARRRGLEKAPIVLEKMQLNRNMMVRMYALNQIAAESVARTKEPGEEARVKHWYQDHLKDRYTFKDNQGKEQVVSFESARARIENDYADDLREQVRMEHLRAMRKNYKIEINEQALQQAVL